MAVTQKTVVLNDFGLARRERTTGAGTSVRYSVSIEATPMVHTFDAKSLGRAPAQAIVDHLRTRVQSIGAEAAPSTVLKRKYATDALTRGAAWATRRYSGGRTGTKAPTGSTKLFNDSGRFAEGLTASPTRDNQWVINVTANRFDPSTFPEGEAGVMRLFVRLRELVPEFGDANRLADIATIRAAITASSEQLVASASFAPGGMGTRDYGAERKRAQLDALRSVLDLAREIDG